MSHEAPDLHRLGAVLSLIVCDLPAYAPSLHTHSSGSDRSQCSACWVQQMGDPSSNLDKNSHCDQLTCCEVADPLFSNRRLQAAIIAVWWVA